MNFETLVCDYDYTESLNSSCYKSGREGNSIGFTVMHHNAGNATFSSVLNTFNANGTSAHYDVRGTEVARYVDDEDTAYHAGNWSKNLTSIGIEMCNDVNKSPWTVSDETLDTGAHLLAAICIKYGLGVPEWGVNVIGHNEVKATTCPGALAEGGSQHDEFMAKAVEYYESMSGGSSTSSTSSTSSSSSSSSSSSTLDLGTDLTIWGPKFSKALQTQRGTTVDGIISGQAKSDAKYFWAVEDGTVEYGTGGSNVMRSLQSMFIGLGYSVGSTGADGYYGYNSICAHQRWLQALGYYNGEVDGYHGKQTNQAMAKALQARAYQA